MKSCWKKLLACATALCVSLTGFGLSFCAESDDERLWRNEAAGDASAEITRVECCGSMNPQYVEAGTALEDLSFTLSVWFEGEEDASGSYTVIPEEITGYDPSEGVKYLTISVTIHGKLYEFKRDVTVLPPEEYRKSQEIRRFIWEYYMHVIYAAVTEETRLDRFENWTVGNFNYDGHITPENVDTLFTHVYYAGYNDWLAAGYLDRETNDFIIPRADVEKMFTKAFTGSPEGLTAAAAYHPETDTFQYGAQGYGGGGPGRYWYEESIDSDGNTVIRFRPEFSDVCAHCNNPTYTCHHNIELVLAPDGRMVSIKLLPREIRLGKYLRATYVVGESLDVEGATIRVLYDDKRSEEIPLTADMVSGYDPEKLGRQTLRVSYGGQYVPFDVMVADEGSVKGLRIYGDTLLLEQGESLDGFSVYLSIYYGDEEISIPLTTDMVSDYDPEKLGRQTLTVSYGGLTTTLEVEVFSHEEAAEKKAFYEKVSWLVGIYYCMAHEGPSVGESFVGWSPENMRFTGKLTEANQEALLQTIVWDKGFEIVDKDLLPPPEGVSGSGYYGYFFKVSEDSMHRLIYDALVYDFPSLMALSCYRPEANCFLVPFVDGWGGPSHEIARYATVTQKENGNWLIQQRKPSPDAGQWEGFGEEIYQFDMEITQDYRLVSFEIIMEKLTWKTPPAKTVYEKGEALDLSGAVITAHHGTGKSFDIPVTPDMVSGYDPEKSGKQTLTVTYGGRQITFDVTVAGDVTGWQAPWHTIYEQGEPLDVEQGFLTIGSGEDSHTVYITADMVSGYDPNKLGKQTLTVSYQGKAQFTYEIEVLSHEDYRTLRFEQMIVCFHCYSGRFTDDTQAYYWHPDFIRFTGKLTEANQKAFFTFAWILGSDLHGFDFPADYEIVDKNLVTLPGYNGGEAYYKIAADDMRRILGVSLVYDESSLTDLSFYREDADCFLIPYTDGWGGPLDLKKYATITQKENGNWLIQYRTDPAAGVEPEELYQFDAEFTPDYQLVYFEVLMEELSWKTAPGKTTYAKGETLDLTGGILTAKHGTGKTFDIPLTAELVSGYDPEKIGKQTLTVTYGGRQITFDVTVTAEAEDKPPVAIDDKETGIKLETDGGVVPPDTVIQAKPVTEGGNFTIVNDALAQTSHKWVAYDISLLSDNVKIQPNGKVKITMPVPKGLNKNKMALFHVADDGTLTQIPFTLDANKQNLIFETDHFSLYAVAETNDDNPSTGDGGQGALPWAAGLLLLAGAAVLLMRKRPAVR